MKLLYSRLDTVFVKIIVRNILHSLTVLLGLGKSKNDVGTFQHVMIFETV